MFLVGITGGIATGKTEVAKVFKKLGAEVISGDKLGREAVEKNKSVLKKLISTFGKDILNKNKSLNRKKLGELVFCSKTSIEKLNSIIHPYILSNLRKEIEKFKGSKNIVVVDAALIVEWGIQDRFDFLILINSKRDDQIKRFCSAKRYSLKTARDVMRRQLPQKTKKRYADLVIDNDGNLRQLREKAKRAWFGILALSIGKEKGLTG
jgi:dephospho-CoA kinase